MIFKRINSLLASAKEYPYYNANHWSSLSSEEEYTDIVQTFLEELAYNLIVTGKIVKLPMMMGALQVVKYKSDGSMPTPVKDFLTIKLLKEKGKYQPGKQVPFRNRATGGYWCRLHWYKSTYKNPLVGKITCAVTNIHNYSIDFTRPNRRPNSYNKWNPRVSMVPFFRDTGWLLYKERQIISSISNDDIEQLQQFKHS